MDRPDLHDSFLHGRGEIDLSAGISDRNSAMVDNHTANEAAKAFALTLDGLFERQLSRWANLKGLEAKDREGLLEYCALTASIDLVKTRIADDLTELHLVANVVRHGEGWSCTELQNIAPQLWDNSSKDYYDLAPGPVPPSDELRIRPDDLRRYARAVVRFWGHVDPLPMAVRDPPY